MKTKYRNKKTVIDGITFDSAKEAQYYQILKLHEKAGLVKEIELQPKFVLQEKFVDSHGEKHQEIAYIADFRYFDCLAGVCIVADVKGLKTAVYTVKKKLLLFRYPELNFIEV